MARRVVTGQFSVRLHNSATEVGALVLEFLTEFANSRLPADRADIVRNFSNSCSGKATELEDVTFNRNTRNINSYTYGTADHHRRIRQHVPLQELPTPVSLRPSSGIQRSMATKAAEIAKGISTISGVYRDSRWWLCDSSFDGTSSLGLHFLN